MSKSNSTELFNEIRIAGPIACAGCSSCAVSCPMGFDVRERALDIIRLRDFPPEFFAGAKDAPLTNFVRNLHQATIH